MTATPELPELPKPAAYRTTFKHTNGWLGGYPEQVPSIDYTAEQMRSYGLACYRAGMEKAAKLVEGVQLVQRGGFPGSADYPDPDEIADMIRADAIRKGE